MYYLISRFGDVLLGLGTGFLAFYQHGKPDRLDLPGIENLYECTPILERHPRNDIPEDKRLLVRRYCSRLNFTSILTSKCFSSNRAW